MSPQARTHTLTLALTLALLSLLAAHIACASPGKLFSVRGKFGPTLPQEALAGITIVIDGKDEVIPRGDGSFALNGLTKGSYVLEVVSVEYQFLQVYITVSADGRATLESHDPLSGLRMPMSSLALSPVSKKKYFQEKPPFELASFLKNPMIIMVAVTGGMMLCMNQVMGSMDPEALREMQGDDGSIGTPPEETLAEIDDIARGIRA